MVGRVIYWFGDGKFGMSVDHVLRRGEGGGEVAVLVSTAQMIKESEWLDCGQTEQGCIGK